MKLAGVDLAIIFLYLTAILIIGLLVRKRAERSKNDYLLGGKRIPWYMLGLSNASGMFDISGTMWLVTLMFVYGLKSAWIPWLWPVFNQIFLMVFLSVWLRRSNVTTGAEWLTTRFSGKWAVASHTAVVFFAVVVGLGFLAYGFIGIGKFVQIFIPWNTVSPYLPFDIAPSYVPHFYGILFTLITVFYSLLGGMMSIVWADVIQYGLMTVASVVIGIIAMQELATHSLSVPEGWMSPFFGWKLNLDWSEIIPEVNIKIESDGYSLFSLFFGMMILKGILVSLAGPAPTYDMQKILSARSPREAALMSGSVSLILVPMRYFMITGFAVLALLFYDKLDLKVGEQPDFEQILPSAIHEFVPAGLLGLLLAGLLAAFMSTFAGTLNSTQAYIVNDIYLKYVNPKADNQKVRNVSWLAGIVMVLISIFMGLYAMDVNDILQWIVSGLYGSYVVSNMLKWYWWRFNGSGFFWGMIGGLVPALSFRFFFPNVLDLYTFPLLLILSLAAALAGTFMAPPTDEETLKSFYKTVKPWGFWKPVHESVVLENPGFTANKDFKRDVFNVIIGTIWQTGLLLVPVYLVLLQFLPAFLASIVVLACMAILKFSWYDKLTNE